MHPKNGCNPNKVSYFSLQEYIDKIELNDNVRYHIEDTSKDFDKYIKALTNYEDKVILEFLTSSFEQEMLDSNLIENHIINPKKLNDKIKEDEKTAYFNNLNISHKRIKDLHQFVTNNEEEYNYRKIDAWVRTLIGKKETIYWYGSNPEDIKKFMDDFIDIYKQKSMSAKDNNAFIKSSLVHLLIMRIHPFKDGNGRTSRIIQNMKFTEAINKVYDYKLKIAPLHLSQSIYLNKQEYYKRLNNIYFDLENENNEEINAWLNFNLNMFDEQIYYMSNRLKEKEKNFKKQDGLKVLSKRMHLKK